MNALLSVCYYAFLAFAFVHLAGCNTRNGQLAIKHRPQAELSLLSADAAADLAAQLANDECERLHGNRPFKPETYKVRLTEGLYTWGHVDPGGPGGLSAQVTFRPDGKDPQVQIWFSTDSLL